MCVHLDGLNAEHQFRVWLTILDNTSHYYYYYSKISPFRNHSNMLNLVLKENVLFLSALKMVVLLNICVETVMHFFSGFFDG